MRIAIAALYPPFDGVPHAGGAFLHAYITHFSQNHKVDLICTTEPEPRTLSTYDGWVGVRLGSAAGRWDQPHALTGSEH